MGIAFDEFWSVYPRKTGKLDAQKAYEKAIRLATIDTIREAAKKFAANCGSDPKFIPHPATWLNQGRWMDERPAAVTSSSGPRSFPPERRWPARPPSLSWANVFIPSHHQFYAVMCARADGFDTDAREYEYDKGGIWVSRLWLHENMASAPRHYPSAYRSTEGTAG